MGSRYLTDLADVVRAAGLVVIEEPGWQTRARSSGGFDSGRPDHLMIHHTASNPSSDGQADVNYCCYTSENRPIANLYLARDARVWVMAAGATNTNGTGTCPHCGTTDNMNVRAIGIECANRGDSTEAYPPGQQEAYAVLVAALQLRYSIPPAAAGIEHAEYAVGRKIDPAGPSRWATTGTWNGAAFRADVAAGWPDHPIQLPEEEPVDYLELMGNSTQYSLFARSGVFAVNITNAEREADKRTRDPAPPTVRTSDAAVLKSLILVGDEPVWYDGSKWPPVSAFGGHLA